MANGKGNPTPTDRTTSPSLKMKRRRERRCKRGSGLVPPKYGQQFERWGASDMMEKAVQKIREALAKLENES